MKMVTNESELKQIISKLSKEDLGNILIDMMKCMSEKQKNQCITLISKFSPNEKNEEQKNKYESRLPQDLIDKKMLQIQEWVEQIENGELYLEADGYEDYSEGYWRDRDWVWEYYDQSDIGSKVLMALEFADDCICDFRYEEALTIYDLLLDMEIQVENEWESFEITLEEMVKEKLIGVDLKQLALMTLYADYQVRKSDERAADMYTYFNYPIFKEIHVEEIFHVGREKLTETDSFWEDWICLLKERTGEVETRLLREAVLYYNGTEGLVQIAEQNYKLHPSLSLTVLEQYQKYHEYEDMEKFGIKALKGIEPQLVIRGKIALKTAFASDCLGHMESMRKCCYEAFYSNSNVRNYLRLFGEDDMAKNYGTKGNEVLKAQVKSSCRNTANNVELQQNVIEDFMYYLLCFYSGKFHVAKEASRNPAGSLGWSGNFIGTGIKLFLIYLYEGAKPTKAIEILADDIGFKDLEAGKNDLLSFEKEIAAECTRQKVSLFWNYFQRWKKYYPMEKEEQDKYLLWVEKIVFHRADAIVSGQFRNHYKSVAILLGAVGDVKNSMGDTAAKSRIREEYKNKFPRHSSFQREMNGFCK